MKRMIEWVVAMLPRRRSPEAVDQPSKSIAVEDLVVPDIYAVEHVDTVPVLKVIDLSSPRNPSRTMRIFSSALYCLRVLRLMSRMICSDDDVRPLGF